MSYVSNIANVQLKMFKPEFQKEIRTMESILGVLKDELKELDNIDLDALDIVEYKHNRERAERIYLEIQAYLSDLNNIISEARRNI